MSGIIANAVQSVCNSSMCRLRILLILFLMGIVVGVCVFARSQLLYNPAKIEQHIRDKTASCESKCVQDTAGIRNLPEVQCKFEKGDESVVILVSSRPEAHTKRTLIRQTWASAKGLVRPGFQVNFRVVFVVGLSDADVKAKVLEEASVHNDIIGGQFIDSVRNDTTKTVYAIKWAVTSCQSASFIMKTSDESLINVDNLIYEIQLIGGSGRRVIGDCEKPIAPIRDPKDIVYISEKSYPHRFLPTTCHSSGGYLIPMFVAIDLVSLFPVMNSDGITSGDVYVAICLNKLNIPRYGIAGFTHDRPLAPSPEYLCDCLVTVGGLEYFERLAVWNVAHAWKCQIRGTLHCWGVVMRYFLIYIVLLAIGVPLMLISFWRLKSCLKTRYAGYRPVSKTWK